MALEDYKYVSPTNTILERFYMIRLGLDASTTCVGYAFTKDEIADAIISTTSSVTAKGIIEQANNTGSEYQNLIKEANHSNIYQK